MTTDALRQWVETETGLTTIWLHPNAPRPARPYAAVQVISSRRLHLPYCSKPNANGEATIESQREITLGVQIHGAADSPDPRSAFILAEALRDSLERTDATSYLHANGWAFRDVELLTDAPELTGTHWQPRAVFDVRFGQTVSQLDDVGLLESAEVTAVVEHGNVTHTVFTTLE